ncbi:hypothetical protein CTAM01_03734 [Colletotrichum tamarilloi]|uniref:Rhodopsin domain-containing protein n=1 Tax=Colletotrichum tamarilloi TaxID=1209934 RepID=A0ABQ9RL70_9PEZI|nr:uncharacterized protein CTAM01_03734 [Colletotrichum tamarilloi]KAK1506399.1 hypothetical protein CTAM01_03734 [Colletotrichum tamarilloi]
MEINPTLLEIWTLYAVATLMIAARVFCRTKQVGVSGFRPDDYIIFFTWVYPILLSLGWIRFRLTSWQSLYTSVCVMATLFALIAQGKHTSLLTPEQRATLPESEFYQWEYGSKNFVAGMIIYATVVWSLKFNMLFFYRRLVAGQWVDKFIFPVMGLVGATAVAMGLIIALTCLPLSLMWQIRPDPGENCVPQNKIYFYSIFVMNVTTDLCIIAIPIPVISLVRASIWRRIGVYFLFSLGVFIMVAATIRVVLIFHPTGGFGPGAMWSIREDFIAIFVGQAPMVVPLFKRRVWAQFYHKYKFTPKSSQVSDGIELSDGISSNHNDKKKPKDPYSLTQLGFTHVTNATLGTRNEATSVANNSSESSAVAVEEVYMLGPIRDFGPDLGAIEFVSREDRHSLEITAVSDLPRAETIKLVSKREEL